MRPSALLRASERPDRFRCVLKVEDKLGSDVQNKSATRRFFSKLFTPVFLEVSRTVASKNLIFCVVFLA